MKKSIAAIGFLALSFVFVYSAFNAEAEAQIFGRTLSIVDLAPKLSTPEQVARFMWKNFLYERDQNQFGKNEYWQAPEEMLRNGKGDCEDFALFAQALLKANGVQAFLLNVYGDGLAHTVCAFKENGTYTVIDGTEVIRYKATTIEALSREINPHWEKSAIVSAAKTSATGRILKMFEKGMQAHRQMIQSA